MQLFSKLFKKRALRSLTPQTTPSAPPTASIIEGRRHRVDTSYLLPNDAKEVSRLDFQHYALQTVIGTNYSAPIEPATTKRMLDVGCGTGRWSAEMAKAYPQSEIYGIDIEIPTFSSPPPPNCFFYEGNVFNGIQFPDSSFDYVHQRLLVGAIPAAQWPVVIRELVRVTRPQGWVELLEVGDVYHNQGPLHHRLQQPWDAGIAQAGFDLSLMSKLDTLLVAAGLKNVALQTIPMPLGKWAGRPGEMMGINLFHAFEGLKGFYASKLGVPAEDFTSALAELPAEWEYYHTTYDFYLVYGQK